MPSPFYHGNDISVYLGRQRGGGVLKQKNAFAHAFFILNQEWCIFHLVNVRNFSAWDRNRKKSPEACAHYRVMVGRPGKEATYTLLFLA